MKYIALSVLLALPTANALATQNLNHAALVDNMTQPLSELSVKSNVQSQSLSGAPATPYTYPGNGGNSYRPLGHTYTIPFNSVSGATYYELYESTNDSNYSKVYTGSRLSADFVHYEYGYRYYKYKACNSSGCSGLSPWRRMYIYTAPSVPKDLSVSPSSVTGGTTYTVNWKPAGGAVDGTVYTVYESANGGTERAVHSKTRQHWSETSYSFATKKQAQGHYSYRIQACSPSVGCGASDTVDQTVTTTNRAPVVVSQSAHVSKCYASYIGGLAYDPDGDSFSLYSVGQPHSGSVHASGSGMWYYPPHNCLSGTTSVSFRAIDSKGLESSYGYLTIWGI